MFDPYYGWLGIPPKDQPPTAYRLLGIEPFESNPLVIEAAAEQRMLLLRARQSGEHSQHSQRLLNEVASARRLLLDPVQKATYDEQLRASLQPMIPTFDRPAPRGKRRPAASATTSYLTAGVALGSVVLLGLLVLTLFWNQESPQAKAAPNRRAHKALRVPTSEKPLVAPAPQSQVDEAASGKTQVASAPVPQPERQPAEPAAVNARLSNPSEAEDRAEESDNQETVVGPAVEPAKKRLLKHSNLKFVGAFKLPQQACGASTGYATGCLALRYVDGKPRLFCDTHIQTGGFVYEVSVPKIAKEAPYPVAEIVQEWGDIYKGRKVKANGEAYQLSEWTPTTGLRWDESGQRLWWTYGEKYNTENQDAPTFGATELKGDQIAAVHGPWRLDAPQSWQRGGTLEIPAWFADKYSEGRRLGVGFGGYYSIFEGGSYGPALLAASPPEKTALGLPNTRLLGYPTPNFCVRSANYRHVEESWMGRNPAGDVGTWNATDEIGGEICAGGGVWIDAPDRHGILFFVTLGTGRIAYEEGGVMSEGRQNALYIYNPNDLVEVAEGKQKIWEPMPDHKEFKDPPGFTGRPAGTAFDPKSGRLYVLWVFAYREGEEAYPMVAVYRV